MSDKNSELHQLGEASLPDDLFTPTLGSNYGMDGFEDLSYGMGVLEGVADPNLHEPPALPSGLVMAGEDGMDLTAMLEGSLQDLDWLDPTAPQDPERLPKNCVDTVIPELEEAWGANRRTDGVQVFAKDLDRARYEDSLGKQAAQSRKATPEQMMKVVTHAMRRSAAGQDIDVVVKQALESMGEEMGRVSKALRLVRGDHGLSGNVFVRASAYPGYGGGKWTSIIKKHASRARYIIVSPAEMKQATWIKDGRCSYTGKIAVTEVPWGQARTFYAPRLESVGRRVASGDPREALRRAFLELPERVAVETNFPKHDPVTRLVAAKAPGILTSPEERKAALHEGKVRARVEKMAADGLISIAARDSILSSGSDPYAMLKAAAQATSADGSRQYQGAHQRRAASLSTTPEPTTPLLSRSVRGALQWIRRSMAEGFAGKDLDSLIQHRFTASLRGEMAAPLQEIRSAHEGGSGFLYVDAEAYASPKGVKGCEEGALRHRANQIPAVTKMDRCGSCSLARVLEDGTSKCGVYNKGLLDDSSGPELERLKRANIKVANMDDSEQTASMFAPAFDPSEYSLHNANLDDVDLITAAEHAPLDISFGGWNLE